MHDGRVACVVASLALLGLACSSTHAQEPKRLRGEKYALLVGVRKYDPNELRSLPYAEPDVVELAGVLKDQGYRPDHVVLMTQTVGAEDDRFLPRSDQVRKELKLLLEDLEPEDSVLIALAGHGVQFRGETENYFCPSNAKLSDRRTLIALGEVYQELEASRAGLKVLLVDACRNDPQSENARARSAVDLESVSRPQKTPPPGGVVAFFSCSEGEKAFEHADLKHGVFFHFVIEALRGAAAGPEESEVLMPDLEKYVKRHVRDFVRVKYGVHQQPELRGTSRDLVPLVTVNRLKPRITNSVGMTLALIPAGEFLMGSDARSDEKPRHRVRITRPFYLGTTEVTVGQFRKVVESSGFRTEAERDGKGGFGWNAEKGTPVDRDPKYSWRSTGWLQTEAHPVVNVSWNDAVAYCNALSKLEGLMPYYAFGAGAQSGGDGYRLPTEAEWEYTCRAGTTTRYESGDDPETLVGVGNVGDATLKSIGGLFAILPFITGRDGYVFTAPVGRFRANAFGLFDMHGNVEEWCWDGYDADYYKGSADADPSGPLKATDRVFRGGSWKDFSSSCRAAVRGRSAPDQRDGFAGFRVARVRSGP